MDQLRKYTMGALVFREGEAADYACLVRTGKFEIYRMDGRGEEHIAHTVQGAIFGELALIDGGKRMAHARCVEEGHLALIDRQRFLAKLKALTPLQRKLFDELLAFVREAPIWTPDVVASDRMTRIIGLVPQIEERKALATGDTFLDVLAKMLVHYAKRRLPQTG